MGEHELKVGPMKQKGSGKEAYKRDRKGKIKGGRRKPREVTLMSKARGESPSAIRSEIRKQEYKLKVKVGAFTRVT